MHNYFNLIKELYPLDRCHSGPEMVKAYELLKKFYNGSRIIKFKQKDIYWWKMPPFWKCDFAELRGPDNKIYASKQRNNLELFTYSPSIDKKINFSNLKNHIIFDKKRPNSLIFHFKNQYRHWEPKWGFSIPYNKFMKMPRGEYTVKIKSSFNKKKEFVQSDFFHKGKTKKEYILIGHFDHPSQVNDGLIGCIAAYEVIRRLKKIKTYFSYRAFASVENVGSVAYLNSKNINSKNINEGLFLTTCGIKSHLSYCNSYFENSKIDRIIKNLFKIKNIKNKIYKHRSLIGNDENIFDSIGYEIPTGTLLRFPHKNYHTSKDNMSITKKDKIEEIINFTLEVIHVLENDYIIKGNFKGIPSLSNPEILMYLEYSHISGMINKKINYNYKKFNLNKNEINYLNKNKHLLHDFMTSLIRMSDGKNSILDVCEKTNMPFNFVLNYCNELKYKGILNYIKIK